MSEDLHKYNDFFRGKLDNHESSVPDDLFERLMSDRGMRGQLSDLESAVPENLFTQLMRDREGSDEMPADAPMRERLLEHEETVLKPTFDDIIAERERRRRALIWRSAAVLALLLMSYFMLIKNENLINSESEKSINEEEINKDNKINSDKSVVINKGNSDNKDSVFNDLNNSLLSENNASYTEWGISLENKNVKNSDSDKKNLSSINSNQAQNTSATTAALINLTTNLKAVSKAANSTNTVSNSANYSTERPAAQQAIIPTTIFSTNSQAATSEPMNILGNKQQTTGDIQQQAINNQLSVVETANLLENAKLETQYPKLETENASRAFGTEGIAFDAKRQVFDFENLSIFKVKNIALPTRDLKNPCASIGPGDGCPTFDKRNRRHGGGEKAFYVDVYGAPEYAFRRFSQNLPESAAYLNTRDTVEKPWYAFSAGARASVVFENGLAVRTGLVYAQTNEIARFDSLGIGEKNIQIKETYTPRLGGGTDTTRVTITTFQQGIFRTTRYNRYRSIDIPLQLGFEFPMNDYWSFSLNGGVNFNISAWRKANILNSNFKSEDISSGLGETNPVFRNSLGLSLFGSVAAYRQLTGNLQLMIEPSIRHSLHPITRTDYALKQAYTHVGLNLGLRLRMW